MDLGAVQEQRTENDGRKQQCLQHPRSSHRDLLAFKVSSHRRQRHEYPNRKHSCSKPVDCMSTDVANTTTNSIQIPAYSVTRPPQERLKPTHAEERSDSLKAGKSPRVDNIPSELLKNGGEAT